MKKDLIKLIDSRKEIEKMFHPFGGGMGTSFERISDVPEFQNWLQEIKLELQGIYDRTHDIFVWETINLCGKRLDGFTEQKYYFICIHAVLLPYNFPICFSFCSALYQSTFFL